MQVPQDDTYFSIAGRAEGFYKEKGSKFLAFAFPVSNQDEIKERLDELRKEYYDARHHCYAWVLGKEGDQWRANDDGEPNHSAGDPILGQIRSAELSDVLIVVIRYFGGTKLGVSGLITAYKTAAAEALQLAERVEKILSIQCTFTFSYPDMNGVMKLVKDFDLTIIHQHFEMECSMTLQIREGHAEAVLSKLSEIESVQLPDSDSED